ncbi:MAG: hypothetical protein E7I11_30390, partial [Klebsiella michiganensis]|nr:hypothetical protein [Klebsiella michiganensis]
SSSPVRWLDFKSSWGRQRSRAGSTPVIFRQFNHFYPCELIQKISLSVQYLSLLARFSPVL